MRYSLKIRTSAGEITRNRVGERTRNFTKEKQLILPSCSTGNEGWFAIASRCNVVAYMAVKRFRFSSLPNNKTLPG